MKESEKAYRNAIMRAYQSAPEGTQEERLLEQVMNLACEREGLSPMDEFAEWSSLRRRQEAAGRHPIQPIEADDKGVWRFRSNPLVKHLLDHGGMDLNRLFAECACSKADRDQFNMLIGYSVDGLPWQDYETAGAVDLMMDGQSEAEARIDVLTIQLRKIREGLREPVAALFHKHPSDLGYEETGS